MSPSGNAIIASADQQACENPGPLAMRSESVSSLVDNIRIKLEITYPNSLSERNILDAFFEETKTVCIKDAILAIIELSSAFGNRKTVDKRSTEEFLNVIRKVQQPEALRDLVYQAATIAENANEKRELFELVKGLKKLLPPPGELMTGLHVTRFRNCIAIRGKELRKALKCPELDFSTVPHQPDYDSKKLPPPSIDLN